MTHEQALELAAAYVLGALTPEEERAVREHLETCPESHDEFFELGSVVPYLGEAVELVEPPAALKTRILQAAARERPSVAGEPAEPRAFPSVDEREARAERAERRRTTPASWALRIAAVLVIGALGAWNIWLQQQYAVADEFRRAVSAVLDTARQEGALAAILEPTEGDGPSGLAAVDANGSIVLALQNLEPTTGTEVYTAWMIVGDAAPVPVGGFTVGADGVAQFTTQPGPAEPGVVIAVSREPAPGSTAPLGPIVSVGVASLPTT